jgi:hypothetical protein
VDSQSLQLALNIELQNLVGNKAAIHVFVYMYVHTCLSGPGLANQWQIMSSGTPERHPLKDFKCMCSYCITNHPES